MRTPFLPADDEAIVVKQGKVGDCAVLAAFMSISNAIDGRQFLKSIYEEKSWGVIIRLKHTDQSYYLDSLAFKDKYGYLHDTFRNQDVFFITYPVLDEIDTLERGVQSNSLLVKTLVRLFSHYFAFSWDKKKRHGSLDAYNASSDLDRHPNLRSAEFVGKLLGAPVEKITDTTAIKIRQTDPQQAIYVSIDYSLAATSIAASSSTSSSRRHALTLDHITPDAHHVGEYKFVLVNPWNSQKTETYTATELRSMQGDFFIFIINPERYKLISWLSALSIQTTNPVDYPQLLQMLCHVQRVCPSLLGPDFIARSVLFHIDMSYLSKIITDLTPQEQVKIYDYINVCNEDQTSFLIYLLTSFPYVWLAVLIIQNESPTPAMDELLAGIALRSTNAVIYAYLVEKKFNFFLFLDQHVAERNAFLGALVELEKPYENNSDRLLVLLVYVMSHWYDSPGAGPSRSIVDELSKQLSVNSAKSTIDWWVFKINHIPISFAHFQSSSAALTHSKVILELLKEMVEDNKKLERAYRILKLAKDEVHPSIARAVDKKKADLEKELQQAFNRIEGGKRRDFSHPNRELFFKQRAFLSTQHNTGSTLETSIEKRDALTHRRISSLV